MIKLREEYFDFSDNHELPEEIEPDDWADSIHDAEKEIYKSILDYGFCIPKSELKPKVMINDDGWYGFNIKHDIETTTEEELAGLWVHRAKNHPVNAFDPPKGQALGVTAKLNNDGIKYIKEFLDGNIE